MSITQITCTSFKKALLDGEMDFSSSSSQSYKIALYTSAATLDAATTAYITSNEASGTGYVAGGKDLTVSTTPATSGTTAYTSFASVVWPTSSITARGALIYQAGGATPSVAVLDFGGDKVSLESDFRVTFPTADAVSAIIRIA